MLCCAVLCCAGQPGKTELYQLVHDEVQRLAVNVAFSTHQFEATVKKHKARPSTCLLTCLRHPPRHRRYHGDCLYSVTVDCHTLAVFVLCARAEGV